MEETPSVTPPKWGPKPFCAHGAPPLDNPPMLGELLFSPDGLHHLCLAKWLPLEHVGHYLVHWVRRPMSKDMVPQKVCGTPVTDPKIVQFLSKLGWSLRKGPESALRSCQDKHLHIFGPLTRIFEMAEGAKATNTPIDPRKLSGWVQTSIYIAINVNTPFSIESHRATGPSFLRLTQNWSTWPLQRSVKKPTVFYSGNPLSIHEYNIEYDH